MSRSFALAIIDARVSNAIGDSSINDFYYFNFEDERLINFTVSDFDSLYETLVSVFGQRNKFIITGSNVSLLSQELGTRLTGRALHSELFPFSFREFLYFSDNEWVE